MYFPSDEISQNSPEMNYGYFTRYTFVHKCLNECIKFYKKYEKVQIVVLGSGNDTFYFNLMKEDKDKEGGYKKRIKYIEMDFHSVVVNKIKVLKKYKIFKQYLIGEKNENFKIENDCLFSDNYSCLSCDLRDSENFQKLLLPLLDKNFPVIVLSEMVLIYMKPEYSEKIIKTFTKNFFESIFIIYESINPFDDFGKQMVEKIQRRGCPLLSIKEYGSLEKQEKRFKSLGYDIAKARDLLTVFHKFMDQNLINEMQKRTREYLDEYTLFNMLMNHYCVTISVKTKLNLQDNVFLYNYFHSK